MNGSSFFYGVIICGLGILGLNGVVGLRVTARPHWGRRETRRWRREWRSVMELGFFALVFALVPLLLSTIMDFETVIWRLASLTLAAFLATYLARLGYRARRYGVLWPGATILLLVILAILLTIEMVNMLWWGALASYAGGLLGILTLAGIQLITVVGYDRADFAQILPLFQQLPKTSGRGARSRDYRHHGVLGQQLQRHHRPDHPDGAPDGHGDLHRHPHPHAQRLRHTHRLAFTRARDRNRRPFTNPAARSRSDLGGNGAQRDPRS